MGERQVPAASTQAYCDQLLEVAEFFSDPRFDLCVCGHCRHRHDGGPCNLEPFVSAGLSKACICTGFVPKMSGTATGEGSRE